LLCPSSPSSLGEVSVITLVALTLVILDPLAFFVALVAVIFTALAIADCQCLLSTTNARTPAARLSSADSAAAAASCLPAKPLLPLMVALFFIVADCYVVASALEPSSHCCSHRHRCHRIVIVTAHPHLRRNLFRRRKRQKSLFLFTAQQIEKSESGPSF
jgi:hypothetical protein